MPSGKSAAFGIQWVLLSTSQEIHLLILKPAINTYFVLVAVKNQSRINYFIQYFFIFYINFNLQVKASQKAKLSKTINALLILVMKMHTIDTMQAYRELNSTVEAEGFK